MMFSFERIEILRIFYFSALQDELSYKTSTMFSSGTEVVLLEMWQTRKRGLCTWYALVKGDVHRMRWITLEISPRPSLHETWSRFSDHDGGDTGCKYARDRQKWFAPFISRCIYSFNVYSHGFCSRKGPTRWIDLGHSATALPALDDSVWMEMDPLQGRRICRRMRDCFREEHDKKK